MGEKAGFSFPRATRFPSFVNLKVLCFIGYMSEKRKCQSSKWVKMELKKTCKYFGIPNPHHCFSAQMEFKNSQRLAFTVSASESIK